MKFAPLATAAATEGSKNCAVAWPAAMPGITPLRSVLWRGSNGRAAETA
jgi:hypothetical protein